MSMIDIPVDGGAIPAYAARPTGTTPSPVLLLLQEVYGVNRFIEAITDYWAQQGFIAIAPELYWRIGPSIVLDPETDGHREKAIATSKQLDTDQCVRDIAAAIGHARAMPGSNGKVATSGYCLGGLLAYLTATRSDADANVSYYGVGIERYLDEAGKIRKPLMLHIGEADHWTPEDVRRQLADKLQSSLVTQHIYENTDHAFARPGASTDVPAMRELANTRTAEFLASALGG